ncbi:cellobiose transport system substrate-binding protein [Okibacterium sp. HSC-33S16]|uniref:ABC transporter substrate-binding protein n=1 Tax=Okibacterium sp. HSC-33S16 TaxID=2910965 RepID=UPI0020A1021D|nr:ABC transporter substrate-binding protein [Okibacterium sp. HSC-33S16]MCP2032616.1 cellobiose transport system substrate-binding protein [Okibacterium sp. HSC-33S16]
MRLTKRSAGIAAFATFTALALTACTGGRGGAGSGGEKATEENKPEKLTVAAWMDFPPELLASFEEEYGIKVAVESFPDGASAQTVLRNGLSSGGAGLSDVHLIELDWWTEMMAAPEDWVELPEIDDRWVDWKVKQGSVDGVITGYGTDIGPLGVAFNQDMTAAAGVATDPESFGEFIGGDAASWESFLDAGRAYVATSDNYFVDSLSSAFQAAVNLLPSAFEDPESGDPYNLADNAEIKELFMTFAEAAADGVSAGIPIGHADWGAGFQNKEWATVITPAWMTGIIAENADGVEGWRVSSAFPEGGGNWGGSFFSVPATGKNTGWAVKLADYLTSADAAVQWFHETGQFPSQLDAIENPDIAETENEFFGGQRLGEVYGSLAASAGDSAAGGFRGENFAGIQTLVTNGIALVESGSATPEDAWASVVSEFEALGFDTAD